MMLGSRQTLRCTNRQLSSSTAGLSAATRRHAVRQAGHWCCRPPRARVQAAATTVLHSSSEEQKQEADEQQQSPTPLPPQQQRRGSSSSGGPGGGSNGGGDDDDEQRPPGPSLPPQLRQLLALLTEFGGKYGTAAVLIAWATQIDPFGGLTWDPAAVRSGLITFLPLMLFDAALMLPDFSIDPAEQRAVAGMFLGPMQQQQQPDSSSNSGSSAQDGGVTPEALSRAAAAAAASGKPVMILPPQEAPADGDDNQAQQQQPGGGGPVTAGPLLRLRVALGLLQQVYTRANPGIGLSPAAEFAVVIVATLADEMLYRAVGLTLLGLWLRDRLFEAGFDDDVALTWLSGVLSDGSVPAVMPTAEFARYMAVGVIAALGMAGFAVGAYREVQTLKQMQVLDREGKEATPAAETLKSQLVSSLGAQNVMLYAVEGAREVTASVMAGVAFVGANNLAAPLAGSIVVQTLFSVWQRVSLGRAKAKRQALVEKMRARNKKVQDALAAALAAKEAEAASAPPPAQQPAAAAESAAVQPAAASSAPDGEQEQAGEPVDLLTAVLQAAEQQQQAAARKPFADAPSDAPASADPAAASAAAQQQLSALLEDMLRSPEGNRVVQAWVAKQQQQEQADGGSSASTSTDSTSSSVQDTVERLLSDPATKDALLAELQGQLLSMSASEQATKPLEDSWRQKL